MRAIFALLLLYSTAQAGVIDFEDVPLGPFTLYRGGIYLQATGEIVELGGDKALRKPAGQSGIMITGKPWTIHSYDVYTANPGLLIAFGTFDSNTPQAVAQFNVTPGWNHITLPGQFYGLREYFQTWIHNEPSPVVWDNIEFSVVPEPSAWVLMLLGCSVLLLRRFIRSAR